jgi:hypothetical protein
LAIITFTLTLAFSHGFRTICAFVVRLSWAYIVTKTGLFKIWKKWGESRLRALEKSEDSRLEAVYKKGEEGNKKISGNERV